jgi:hypothetical protein
VETVNATVVGVGRLIVSMLDYAGSLPQYQTGHGGILRLTRVVTAWLRRT